MSLGAGRAKSPARDEPAKRFGGLTGARCPGKAMAGGMQRGRAAGPLAKGVLYYNTHLACGAAWKSYREIICWSPLSEPLSISVQ